MSSLVWFAENNPRFTASCPRLTQALQVQVRRLLAEAGVRLKVALALDRSRTERLIS